MNTISPATAELARRLLAFEASRGPPSKAHADHATRGCERLRAPIARLAGSASYRSLLSRALALAKAEAPSLASLHVGEDGSLERAGDVEGHSDAEDAPGVEAALLAHLLGLLVTFIGEPLTLLLVRDAWPDIAITEIDLAIKAKHERDQ